MLKYAVPISVQKVARAAHALHEAGTHPLDDVQGEAVAFMLSTGEVQLGTVSKMHRFFTVNDARYCAECDTLRTEVDGATTRSWFLHGGDAGRRWAAKVYRDAAAQGLVNEDPILDLFALDPNGVYGAFQAGAWRYEYDLNPRKAAKFVDEYVRATGATFDIRQAFGDAAPAVGNALYRRFHAPDLMRERMRELFEDESNYDGPYALIDEALKLNTWTSMAATAAAKLTWPTLVAYLAVADKDAHITKKLNLAPNRRIGGLHQPTLNAKMYNDAVNTFNMYFNVNSPKYDDAKDAETLGFSDLEYELHDVMDEVGRGIQVTKSTILPLMKDALAWAKKSGHYHPNFQAAVNAYNVGDYAKLLAVLPVDSDVYPVFKETFGLSAQPIEPEEVEKAVGKPDATDALVDKVMQGSKAWSKPDTVSKPEPATATTLPVPELTHGGEEADGEYTVEEFIKDTFGDDASELKYKLFVATTTHSAATNKYAGLNFPEGSVILHVASGSYFSVVKAYLVKSPVKDQDTGELYDGGDIVIVTKDEDGQYNHANDDKLASLIEVEKVIPADIESAEHIDELKDEPLPESVLQGLVNAYSDIFVDGIAQIDFVTTTSAYNESVKAGNRGHQYEKWALVMPAMGEATQLTLHGAVEGGGEQLIVMAESGDLDTVVDNTLSDKLFTSWVSKGKLVPWHKYEEQEKAAAKVKPQYAPGTVLEINGEEFYVVGFTDTHYAEPFYVVASMEFDMGATGTAELKAFSDVEIGGQKTYASATLQQLAQLALEKAIDYYATDVVPAGLHIKVGDTVQLLGGNHGTLVGFYTTQFPLGQEADYMVVAINAEHSLTGFSYPKLVITGLAKYVSAPQPGYEPGEKPEPGSEDSVSDGKPPINYLFGTPGAYKWLTDTPAEAKGTVNLMFPEAPANAPMGTYEFALGEKRQWKEANYAVTIVGFIRLEGKGTPTYAYIILSDKGKYNWKTTQKGHVDYANLWETDQSVIDEAIPLPDWTPEPYPKLNYTLGKAAKWIADNKGILFQKSISPAPFMVGTYVVGPAVGKWRVVGWTKDVPTDADDAPRAMVLAIDNFSTKAGGVTAWHKVSSASVSSWSIEHQTTTEYDPSTDDIAFSKMANQKQDVTITSVGVLKIPSELPAGWEDTTPVKQPPFEKLLPGKHASAGVVAIVYPYSVVAKTEGMSAGIKPLDFGVVLVRPFNDFAGYKLSFPKGTVDKGEGVQHAAVREFYEETGMSAKPLALLGDYVGNTSVTRYFVGHLTGGDPSKAGPETDGVFIKTLHEDWDKVTKQPWYSDLHSRDQKALKDAHMWFFASVYGSATTIHEASLDEAQSDIQVSSPQSNGSKGPQTVKAGTGDETPLLGYKFGNATKDPSKAGYAIASDVVLAVNKHMAGKNLWGFVDQSVVVAKHEYPNVGAKVDYTGTSGHKTLLTVVAYSLFSADTAGSALVQLWAKNEDGSVVNVAVGAVASSPDAGNYAKYIGPQMFKDPMKVDTLSAEAPKPIPAVTDPSVWNKLTSTPRVLIDAGMLSQIKMKWKEDTGFDNPLDAVPLRLVTQTMKNKAGSYVGPEYFGGFAGIGGDSVEKGICVGWVHLFKPTADGTPDIKESILYMIGLNFKHNRRVYQYDKVMHHDVMEAASAGWTPEYTAPSQSQQDWVVKFAKGTTNSYGGVGSFKDMCKQSGMKGHSKINKMNLRMYACLFIPLPWSIRKYITHALKLHHAAVKTKKKMAPFTMTIGGAPSTYVPSNVVVPPPKPALFDPEHVKFVDNPDASALTSTGKTVPGGSKPNKLLNGPNGTTWFYKTTHGDDTFRADIDRAAYEMATAVGRKVLPVGIVTFEGKKGSIQPYLSDAKSVTVAAEDLETSQIADLLGQHVLDMFVGDHDGHSGNWLKVGDKLVPIDRGQSFKFLFQKTADSLDPSWDAPGNVGSNYAKGLLVKWGKNAVELPQMAIVAMRMTISGIQALTDKQIETILGPVFEGRDSSAAERKHVVAALKKRRDTLLTDWTEVMENLRSDFEWPGIGKGSKSFVSEPSDMKFGAKESQIIQDAVEAKWQGKCLQLDRDAIENHQVMVRGVKQADGSLATLIHFRLSALFANDIVSNLFKRAGVDKKQVSATASSAGNYISGTPEQGYAQDIGKVLKIDTENHLFDKIRKAIGTLNYHNTGVGSPGSATITPDGKYNEDTVSAALGLESALNAIQALAEKDEKGTYPVTGDPNPEVVKMTKLYLDYLAVIKHIAENVQSFIGKPSEKLAQFTISQAVKGTEKAKATAEKLDDGLKVTYIASGAEWPGLKAGSNGDYPAISGSGTTASGSNISQFVIRDPGTDAVVRIAPPRGTPGAAGTKGFNGMGWGLVALPPSAVSVAHLTKIVEAVTTIAMRPASESDRKFHYWLTQALVTQNAGTVHPGVKGSVSDPVLVTAQAQYHSGDVDDAVSAVKAYVADYMDVSVDQLESLSGYDLEPDYDRNFGFARVKRVDVSLAAIEAAFSARKLRPAHRIIHGGLLKALELISKNGALLANNMKPFVGVPWSSGNVGTSVPTDFSYGGTQGIFGTIQKGKSGGSGTMYFDYSILLRPDVYIVGWNSDEFGKDDHERIQAILPPSKLTAKIALRLINASYTPMESPDRMLMQKTLKAIAGDGPDAVSTVDRDRTLMLVNEHLQCFLNAGRTGDISESSRPQVNYRHDIDLRKYLWTAVVSSYEITKVKELCKSIGWTSFAQGRTIDQVFVTG